jgi:lipoprotein-anchoring transpeptidase ErfK/SrfK
MAWLECGAFGQRPMLKATLVGAALMALAGCADTINPTPLPVLDPPKVLYGAMTDDGFNVAAAPIKQIPPQFLRQVVDTPASIPGDAGTVVVDPADRYLYLILGGGKAMRYGIGVGKEGFAWSGEAQIGDKQHWPKWFPPSDMVDRDPKLKQFAKGEDGGPRNPLGSRAMYLWSGNVDTLYRIHGTNDPLSIGKAVSSGCVRMLDQDVIDLYERVPLRTNVIVLGTAGTTPLADIMQQQQDTLPIKARPTAADKTKG